MVGQFVIALSFEAVIIFLSLIIGFALGSSKDKETSRETVSENTMFKVAQTLDKIGMDSDESANLVRLLQEQGILFREKVQQ